MQLSVGGINIAATAINTEHYTDHIPALTKLLASVFLSISPIVS